MKFKTKLITLVVAFLAAISFALPSQVNAANTDMVDTSNHNGLMTYDNYYDMLVHYGVKAVVQKVSEGTTYVDPTAKYNLASAKQAGLYLNGYHFARYTTVEGARAEARFAVAAAQSAGLPIGAVLATDVEASEQANNSYAANTANNKAFMEVVQAAGYRSTIYTMGSWVGTKMSVDKGWIADYPYNTSRDRYTSHHAWQFRSDQQFAGSYGNFDVSQLYDDFFTANQTPSPSAPVTPAPSQPAKSNVASDTDYAQTGVFKPSTTVYIRTGAGTGYASVGSYAPGESVIYDHVYIRGTYVWARYLSYSGRYHYVALGVNGGESYGSRSSGYTSPVSHTYYTVRSGDSFWSIASKYGISMYTLAANNGKSIYSLIYPGESLYIR